MSSFDKKGPFSNLKHKLNIIKNKTPLQYDIVLERAEVEVRDLQDKDMDGIYRARK